MNPWHVETGDCLQVLAGEDKNSFDAVVTDPPYELNFMNKAWDSSGIAFRKETWAAVLRVLKPGGHLLAFSGTRTSHRMVCAIEDAGFEIRDSISWIFGQGFPKSLDVSKAFDKGVERPVLEVRGTKAGSLTDAGYTTRVADVRTGAVTDLAKRWEGWGTALKPATEPVCVARKPLEGTVAQNVAKWGTGCLNIGGCRIGTEARHNAPAGNPRARGLTEQGFMGGMREDAEGRECVGRWPANVVLDEEAGAMMDQQSGVSSSMIGKRSGKNAGCLGAFAGQEEVQMGHTDSGGASRFFYCAKASRAERERGCEGLPPRSGAEAVEREPDSAGVQNPRAGAGRTASQVRNFHPTVKPVSLMRWLVRLVTPPGGVVLDPFAGSGTTGIAALLEGKDFVGIEMLPEHADIARARISAWREYEEK